MSWLWVYMLGLLAVLSPVVSGSLTAVNPSDLESPPRYANPNLPGILCLMCSPGTYLRRHCTQNLTISDCLECEPGKFSINYNRAESCATCRTPAKGCPLRNAHLVISCNKTTNNYCVCNPGYYYHSKSQNPMLEYEGDCELHSRCPLGEGVKLRGTANNDTKCEPCPVGTFSDKESSTAACRSYKNCSAGNVPVRGTRMTDVSCRPKGSEDSIPVAAIVVPIVVIVCIIAGIGIGVFFYCRKKKNGDANESDISDDERRSFTGPPDGSNGGTYVALFPKETPSAPTEPPLDTPSEPPVVTPSELPLDTPSELPSDTPSESPANRPRNGTSEPKQRPKVAWDVVNRFLAVKLSGTKDYKMALRSIMSQSGYSRGEELINEHMENHPRNVKEVIFQVLNDITQKCRPSLDNVIKGLEEQDMLQIVKELKQHESVKNFLDNE